MKKFVKSFLIIALVIFMAGTLTANAIFDDLIPQPVYSIAQGLEVDKMNTLTGMAGRIEDITKSSQSTNKLLACIMGGPNASQDVLDIITMPPDEIARRYKNRLVDLWNGLIGKLITKVSTVSPMDERDINNTISTLSYKSSNLNPGQILYNRMKIMDSVCTKFQAKYAGFKIPKDKVTEQNITDPGVSMHSFVKMQQDNLNSINDRLQKADNASLSLLLQILAQEQLQTNQINLKVLEALVDQNQLQYVMAVKEYENIREKVLNSKLTNGGL